MKFLEQSSVQEQSEMVSKDQLIMEFMRKCNGLIKKSESLEEGVLKLDEIDYDDLNSGGLRMYYRYIKGKYYSRKYRYSINKDIELLERANDQFDEIPRIAHEYGVKPRKEQYLFVRINTKFQLGKFHSGETAAHFLNHAMRLANHAAKIYTDASGSFKWIKDQLEDYSGSLIANASKSNF